MCMSELFVTDNFVSVYSSRISCVHMFSLFPGESFEQNDLRPRYVIITEIVCLFCENEWVKRYGLFISPNRGFYMKQKMLKLEACQR